MTPSAGGSNIPASQQVTDGFVTLTRPCLSCKAVIPGDAAFCPMCGASTNAPVLGDTVLGAERGSGSSSSWEMVPERLQAALGPSFELGRLLGRGGYAEVFAVRDTRLRRELAIKVLRPDLIVTEALLARFRREAEAVSALEHPGIVPVYDVGEADGIWWLMMPLVRGETVKSILARELRIPADEARRILVEAAGALQAAHAAGVVHRDIKPENLMLDGRTGRVLLMDFGIAKAMDASGETRITGTGVVVGTPRYMSPEQAIGSHTPDPRSDQYSLAVVGYQMISGAVPFEGENVREVLARQMLEEPVPLSRWVPDVPQEISSAIHQALRKEPRLRFASMDAFARALKGEAVSPEEGGRVKRDSKFNIPHRRRRWAAALAWTVTIAGVAWGANRLEMGGRAPAPPDPARDPPSLDARGGAQRARPPAAVRTGADRTAEPPPPSRAAAPAPVRPDTASNAPPAAGKPAPTCAGAYTAGDWAAAFALCRVDAGTNIVARRMVGILYAEGKGVERDDRQASVFLRDAAEDADPQAVWLMAQRYEVGLGTEPSAEKAAGLYLVAATLGRREAWPLVAERYAAGNGFRKNEEEAFKWWRRAADSAGHIPSMTRVAEAYSRGRGVKKDELLAQSWYIRAAEKGEPEAEYQLGMMLLKGKGVVKDLYSARGWLERAAKQGHAAAQVELRKITPPGR